VSSWQKAPPPIVFSNAKQNRQANERPTSNAQMYDKFSRSAELQLEKSTMYFMEVTNKVGDVTAYFEPMVLTMRNVDTPPTHGRLRVDGIILPEPKANLYGRSESACFTLVETLGEAYSAAATVQTPARKQAVVFENLKEKGFNLHFAQDNKPWPAEAKTKARARKRLLTSEDRESDEEEDEGAIVPF